MRHVIFLYLLIGTKGGLIPIKDVTEKDEVYAYNEDTGKVEFKESKKNLYKRKQ